MSHSSNISDDYQKKNLERRQRKKLNQQSLRRRCKRKRSLVSHLSLHSTSSILLDETSNNLGSVENGVKRLSDSLSSITILKNTNDDIFDFEQSDDGSNIEDDISIISSTSSSTCSDDTEDDLSDGPSKIGDLFDHRPLHEYTSSTVQQFSMDLLEFFRISRLPKNQRSHLLEMFARYLPSPNLVPLSVDCLNGKFLIGYRVSIIILER